MLWVQGRAKRTRRGAGHSSSRRCLEISESKNLTAESHEQKNRWPEHHLRTKSMFRFCTNDIYFRDQTKIWSSESDPHNNQPDNRGFRRKKKSLQATYDTMNMICTITINTRARSTGFLSWNQGDRVIARQHGQYSCCLRMRRTIPCILLGVLPLDQIDNRFSSHDPDLSGQIDASSVWSVWSVWRVWSTVAHVAWWEP